MNKDIKENKNLSGNKRFKLYKNTVEIRSDFDETPSFIVRKEDILGYRHEECELLIFDYLKFLGLIPAHLSIDEWAKEEGCDKDRKYIGIAVFFSERVVPFVDQFLYKKGNIEGEYIFYYSPDEFKCDDVSNNVYFDDLKELEKL